MSSSVKHNPFATRFTQPSVMPYLGDQSVIDSIGKSFETAGWFGQIVGPHGSGKTTLCRTLAMTPTATNQFTSTHYLSIRTSKEIRIDQVIRADNTHIDKTESTQRLMVLDGLERLSMIQQQLLIGNIRSNKTFGGLVVTSHHPINFFKTIWTIQPSLTTLHLVVEHLAPEEKIPTDELARIFKACNFNIRESLMLLYDRFESV